MAGGTASYALALQNERKALRKGRDAPDQASGRRRERVPHDEAGEPVGLWSGPSQLRAGELATASEGLVVGIDEAVLVGLDAQAAPYGSLVEMERGRAVEAASDIGDQRLVAEPAAGPAP